MTTVNPGDRYGMLTVIEFDHREHGRSYWLCKCDCGNTKIISGRSVHDDYPKSCGCLSRAAMRMHTYQGVTMTQEKWIKHIGCAHTTFLNHLRKCETKG